MILGIGAPGADERAVLASVLLSESGFRDGLKA
jgi:hypothetical protein